MAKIKVENLTAAQLNWAVAKAEGWIDNEESWLFKAYNVGLYSPSTAWHLAGPIIEREGITLEGPAFNGDTWQAHLWTDQVVDFIVCEGATPLIAAMKCYVISKLGKTVEVPDAL